MLQMDFTDPDLSFDKNAQEKKYQPQQDLGYAEFDFAIAPVNDGLGFGVDLKSSNRKEKQIMDFKKGTTTLAFLYQGGIIVAVDSRASMGTFNSSESVRKIIEINSYIIGTMAGGAADCQFWDSYIAKEARLYELQHGEKMTVAGRPE